MNIPSLFNQDKKCKPQRNEITPNKSIFCKYLSCSALCFSIYQTELHNNRKIILFYIFEWIRKIHRYLMNLNKLTIIFIIDNQKHMIVIILFYDIK